MKGARYRARWWSRGFAVLALLAFAARALTPAGYMFSPAEDAGRFVQVTLCSAHGRIVATVDRQTGELATDAERPGAPARDQRGGKSDGPCVFAVATHIPLPDAAPPLSARARRFEAVHFGMVAATARHGLAAPPPWATGPPQSA